ncbi:MAG: biotin/lipoyl-binding protein, partial [Pseudomonadota bacterium]
MKLSMNRKWIGGLVIGAVLCVPVILKYTRSDTQQVVETEKIATHEIKASILASGHLVYQEQVQLSPEVLGKVSEILVKEGQQVREGDVVLLLNDQSYRAEVA